MQLEATDWSIRPTLVVHPQGFTPRPVQLSMAVDTQMSDVHSSIGATFRGGRTDHDAPRLVRPRLMTSFSP